MASSQSHTVVRSGPVSKKMASKTVVNEDNNFPDIEARIIKLCGKADSAISDKDLQAEIPNSTIQQRVAALNLLISKNKIELLRRGKEVLYKLKTQKQASGPVGKDSEEKVVYEIVANAKSKGVWTRDIRIKSNLSYVMCNKILKILEHKKLIKAVKPVNESKKKIYMLYGEEPDGSVTGGSWYSDQDFESEYVDVLNEQCFRYLQRVAIAAKEKKLDPISQRNASFKSSKDVCKYIKELGISKVELSETDINCILNTLVYDSKVEKVTRDEVNFYRALNPVSHLAPLVSVPCGMCPLVRDCHDRGNITPQNCSYIYEWLKF